MNQDIQNAFIFLVRLGIGHILSPLPERIDWKAIEDLANKHGLLAVLIDGMERLPEEQRPPKVLLLEWIGNTLQNYEQRYTLYEKAIGELAGFYNQHDFRMMLLKGYACGLDWPKPEHRPCGDIDIWLFGQQQAADKELGSWFKVHGSSSKIDASHHHHTVFEWMGFSVENHYDFDNVHAHKSNKVIEVEFKKLGADDSNFVELNGEKIYLPSPRLNSLFLLRHMLGHFAAAEINLRQVLDWAFFVEKHTKEVDWKWLLSELERYHMKEFFNLINAICVEDLGFSVDIFPSVRFVPELKERVLEDILDPEYTAAEPCGFLPRVIYKYKRWQGNAWKQEMCYGESRWSAFWSGIWAKILKPSSI